MKRNSSNNSKKYKTRNNRWFDPKLSSCVSYLLQSQLCLYLIVFKTNIFVSHSLLNFQIMEFTANRSNVYVLSQRYQICEANLVFIILKYFHLTEVCNAKSFHNSSDLLCRLEGVLLWTMLTTLFECLTCESFFAAFFSK